MSEQPSWDAVNEEFLAAALAWLRHRLTWFAGQPDDEEAAGGTDHAAALKAAGNAAARMEEAARADEPPAAVVLQEQLGLRRFERDVLLLCAAVELDLSIPGLCAKAQGDPRMTYPTFALALSLFDEPSWDAVAPLGGLRYWRLIEIAQPAGQPLTSSVLRADERIVSYLKGLNYVDERLEPLVTPVAPPDLSDLPSSHQELVGSICRRWALGNPGAVPPLLQLSGPDPDTKRMIAARAATVLGRTLHTLPAEALPAVPTDADEIARLWHRESLLTPVALFVDAQDFEPAGHGDGKSESVARFLARSDGVTFLGVREGWPSLPREHAAFDVDRPHVSEQRIAWADALGERVCGCGAVEAELASQFSVSVPAIQRIAHHVMADAPDADSDELRWRLWDECLLTTRPRMDALARRVTPKATWDDIVLPEPELELLRALASQVRNRSTVYEAWGFAKRMNRGLGISALFAGASGTGKSMAAEVLANDLRLTLYRVDLSAVVSKYIGETEKNLRRLFDAAEEGGALLLFDEADALFGKRSEVKDSHDRYANIEINYLLQRMEAYPGVAILATNMKSALDTAFMRRLRFVVNFPYPSAEERRLMWTKAFPDATPTAALDFDHLAELAATGAMIHNVAVGAAFRAADADSEVSMDLILEVARAEFRKLELPTVERQFQPAAVNGVPA
jgi:hypothetical protein